MKKRAIALLLAIAMVLSLCVPTLAEEPTSATPVAKVGDVEFNTLGNAIKAEVKQNGDGKWYLDAEHSGVAYDTEALAKAAVPTYQKGDGKYYLDAGYTAPGYNTAEAAQENATVYHWTEGESGDGKWYLNEEHSGEAYENEASAKAAVQTYQNGDGKFYLDESFTKPEGGKDSAAEAKDEAVVYQHGDGKYYITGDVANTGYATAEAATAALGDKVITLLADCGSDGFNGSAAAEQFDFESKTLTLDLAGHKLLGVAQGAANVTVENLAKPVYKTDGNGQPTEVVDYYVDTPATLLGAAGTYANDVSAYVADGYDVRGTGKTEVFNNENIDNFNIVLEVTPNKGDRDTSSTDIMDVFADDIVTVTVKVTGGRYVSADMFLTWDKTLFDDVTKERDIKTGWKKQQDSGYYRFTKAHDKVDGKPQEEYFEDGEVIGKFQFKAKYIDEEIVKAYTDETYSSATTQSSYCTFTVKNTAEGAETETAEVIGSWRKSGLGAAAEHLLTNNLKDDVAHIVLMDSMTGSVEAKEGLIYKAIPLDLLNKTYNTNGYSALVGGEAVANSKVATKVYTKDEYYGVQQKDNNGNLLYYTTEDKNVTGTDVTEWPVYEEGKAPLASVTYGTAGASINALAEANYQATNAGDYVVCYKVSAPGYVSSTGIREVHIAKQPVTLTWSAPAYETGAAGGKSFGTDNLGSTATADFYGQFDAVGFKNPTATYVDLNPTTQTIGSTAGEVLLTTGPNGTTQKDVGSYLFTAAVNQNYEFTNPTCTVQVVGLKIEGYQLTATGSTTDPEQGVMWRDGIDRPIGSLVVADTASFEESTTEAGKYYTTDGTEVTNVAIKYEYSIDGGDTWLDVPGNDPTASPKYSALGEYKLRMTMTAYNYEKLEQEVTFTIKDPIFKVETTEYVPGYTLVLVYTNEKNVTFRYGDTMMYDESMFGYKYQNTTPYTYVYGLVVKGVADESLVYASNGEAQDLKIPEDCNINDVNSTSDGEKNVSLADVTVIQSIYNVNAENMKVMYIVLRADVNRDKKVDTIGDVAQAKDCYLGL